MDALAESMAPLLVDHLKLATSTCPDEDIATMQPLSRLAEESAAAAFGIAMRRALDKAAPLCLIGDPLRIAARSPAVAHSYQHRARSFYEVPVALS